MLGFKNRGEIWLSALRRIGKEKKQAEISPMRRDYFTAPEFRKIRFLLPDYELELIDGEITANSRSPLKYISIADFEKVADEFPDHRIELINGEITMMPPPARVVDCRSSLFLEQSTRFCEAGVCACLTTWTKSS